MKIDFLCQWYPPEPARVPLAITTALTQLGHEVRVITGIPNYPSGVVHRGYNAWHYHREITAEAEVISCPLFPSHDASAFRRMLNYATFALTSVPPLLFSPRADATLVYSSPGTVNLSAGLSRAIRRTPTVLLVEDLWPDTVLATGMLNRLPAPGLLRRLLHRVFDATYRAADHVVVTSPGMGDALLARRVTPSRLSSMFNWQDRENTGSYLEAAHPVSDGLRIVYGGNLGTAQGLETAIRAMTLLGAEFHLTMIGEGTERNRLERLAKELAPGRIEFRERLGAAEFETLASSFDVSLISLAAEPLFEMTLPGKLTATLALGCPVVLSGSGDVRRIVDDSGAGWSAAAGDIEGLAIALRAAKQAGVNGRMKAGRRGFEFYREYMSPAAGARTLDMVLAAVIRRKVQE